MNSFTGDICGLSLSESKKKIVAIQCAAFSEETHEWKDIALLQKCKLILACDT